jgi:hypothetical protein
VRSRVRRLGSREDQHCNRERELRACLQDFFDAVVYEDGTVFIVRMKALPINVSLNDACFADTCAANAVKRILSTLCPTENIQKLNYLRVVLRILLGYNLNLKCTRFNN